MNNALEHWWLLWRAECIVKDWPRRAEVDDIYGDIVRALIESAPRFRKKPTRDRARWEADILAHVLNEAHRIAPESPTLWKPYPGARLPRKRAPLARACALPADRKRLTHDGYSGDTVRRYLRDARRVWGNYPVAWRALTEAIELMWETTREARRQGDELAHVDSPEIVVSPRELGNMAFYLYLLERVYNDGTDADEVAAVLRRADPLGDLERWWQESLAFAASESPPPLRVA